MPSNISRIAWVPKQDADATHLRCHPLEIGIAINPFCSIPSDTTAGQLMPVFLDEGSDQAAHTIVGGRGDPPILDRYSPPNPHVEFWSTIAR
eukprot:2327256-Amphidinium_carterae.1